MDCRGTYIHLHWCTRFIDYDFWKYARDHFSYCLQSIRANADRYGRIEFSNWGKNRNYPHEDLSICKDMCCNIVFFRKPGQCPAIHHVAIGSGGEVIPCWYIVVKTEIMGNTVDDDFVDIWNSEKYKNYRYKMLNDWANPLCHRCIGVGVTSTRRAL